jgi:N-formylglutamate amidohydrolase
LTRYGEGEVDDKAIFVDQLHVAAFRAEGMGMSLAVQEIRGDDKEAQRPQAVLVRPATSPHTGIVVACPHSGRYYPPELVNISRLDAFTLRRSEDAFVDKLFQGAPAIGADLLVNCFARAFVDVNRDENELDPSLITDMPISTHRLTDRVKAGLGVIPRTVGDGVDIYRTKVTPADVRARLDEVYLPWHEAISGYLNTAHSQCGVCVLLDCHSMPNAASGDPQVDIVLGDRFGSSCAPVLMNEALAFLRESGFKVGRNDPYAGGYSTIRHANAVAGRHGLQIEINRSLYMVEGALTQRPCFDDITQAMTKFVERLAHVSCTLLARQISPTAF